MAETLCHRGPDAQGQWLSPRAALAHRRLIVIDPQTGGQPMVYQKEIGHTSSRIMEKPTTFASYGANWRATAIPSAHAQIRRCSCTLMWNGEKNASGI